MVLSAEDKGYRQCILTVMDNIADPDIRFDEKGVSSYVHDFYTHYEKNIPPNASELLPQIIEKIKKDGKGKPYDCLTGISGGVDSSYLIYKAKEWGLRPLIVHFDNGWNSEIAVRNINNIISKTGFELFTLVVNWEEFKDIQLSYIKAGVVDLEVPTDHAIYATWFKLSKKFKINYVLNGNNYITESIMPNSWIYNKADSVNLMNIHKQFGTKELKTYPLYKPMQQLLYKNILNIEVIKPLNLIDYNKATAKMTLINEFGWADYGGKHYESLYTKFYQAYILPEKFKIDKRKAHLSNLILAKQITKGDALKELETQLYAPLELAADKKYFLKKLGITGDFWDDYLKKSRVEHLVYGRQEFLSEMYPIIKLLRPIYKFFKRK
ncbi:MAG TPA: N-acetyl sugar amidotransferase [Flavipsychrobacter sp.]|nr:N-acetyl sugar amidotransferase [Flavipsychrobacter sp.]